MMQFNHVSKTYRNGLQALKSVDFSLQPGEMAFLTGHSGAGKSTLLKLLMLMERPTYGQVLINNRSINNFNRHQIAMHRREVGMIFQSPQLLEEQTVFENVALPLIIAGFSKRDIARRVRAALDKVGLLLKEQLYPLALSGGEQQRVGIARAIVNRPKILIADEPTGNLDPELSGEIMRLLSDFSQAGVTVLIATHDLDVIKHFACRVLTLSGGELVDDSPAGVGV